MDRTHLQTLADHADIRAKEHLATALHWTKLSGPVAAQDDLIKAGAYLRVRDELRAELGKGE